MDAGSRRLLGLVAIAALALRLGFAFGYWVDKPLTRDEREYLSLARSLTAGRGFVYDEVVTAGGGDPFGRAPGYPAFIALSGAGRTVTEGVPAALKITQSIAGAIGVVLMGVVTARVFGTRAGLIAAGLAAGYPPLVWVSAYALSEGVFWPMGLLTVWLFDRALQGRGAQASGREAPLAGHAPNVRAALAAGLVAGAAVLVRPAMLFFLLLAGPWLIWRREWRVLAALVVGSALVVLPWTARNYAHHGRLVVVASEGGVTFWTGNHPRAIGEGDLAANTHLKIEQQALRAKFPSLTEEQMEPVYYREAFTWIRSAPLDWLALELRKLYYFVVPSGPSYTLHSRLYVAASVIPYLVVLPLAIAGAIRHRAALSRTPGLWLLLGSAVVMSLAFFPQERFRIPIVDPALIVLAAACLASWPARRARA